MLNKHSVRIARTIAEQTNVSLESGHNLFTEAIRHSLPRFGAGKQVSFEDAVTQVAAVADIEIGDDRLSQHEDAVENAVEILLIGMTQQFDYVRNTVRPFISSTTDALINRLKSSTPAEYSLKEFEISEFLTSDISANLFKVVELSNYYKIADGGTAKSAEQILQDISTNIPEIDAAVGEIVAQVGNQGVEDIYKALFCNERPSDNTELTDMIRRLIVKNDAGYRIGIYSLEEVDFLLLTYFIAEGYLDNPIDGTGLSLQEYGTYIRQLMNNIGSSIARLVNAYKRDVESKVLYLRRPNVSGLFFDAKQGEILVLKPVARMAFEQGLVAEQLIGGAIHPQRKLFKLDEVINAKAECLNAYQAMDKQRSIQTAATMVNRINDALQIVLSDALNDTTEDNFPADFSRAQAIANIPQVTNILKSYFYNWDSSEEIEIYPLMLKIICELIFPFTDAYQILETMERIANEEEVDPRYAAYYAEVEYMSRWMVANFHIGTDEE